MEFPHDFWRSPIWKTASRRGLREISKMVSQGNITGASRLASTPGVIKPSAAGSQIRHLGSGSEGLSTLVAHPEHGAAVRKLYDPRGISTPEMVRRKEEAGKALGNNPNFARFLGSSKTPYGRTSMHFSEYVPSDPKLISTPSAVKTTTQNAKDALQSIGYEGHDIRKGNMILDSRTGQHKVIDYIPAKPGEMTSDPRMPNEIKVNESGSHLFHEGRQGPATAGGMLGRLLGGNRSPAVRPAATGGSAVPSAVTGIAMRNKPAAPITSATALAKPPRLALPPLPGQR